MIGSLNAPFPTLDLGHDVGSHTPLLAMQVAAAGVPDPGGGSLVASGGAEETSVTVITTVANVS